MSTTSVGNYAEELVKKWYLDKGFSLLAQNFEYRRNNFRGRMGEIDLLLKKDNSVRIVEVKYRSKLLDRTLESVITRKKKQLLYVTWEYFLMQSENQYLRKFFPQIDIALVIGKSIQVIENAITY